MLLKAAMVSSIVTSTSTYSVTGPNSIKCTGLRLRVLCTVTVILTVAFQVKEGTLAGLSEIGVRQDSLSGPQYNNMAIVEPGWGANSAYFKSEGGIVNVGLGRGAALDKFNANIVGAARIPRP